MRCMGTHPAHLQGPKALVLHSCKTAWGRAGRCRSYAAGAAHGLGSISQGGKEESELLWAGYSEHSEQLQKMQVQHEKMLTTIEQLQGQIVALQRHPPASVWQAASFLLFFLGFINFVGLIASFNLGLFLPWAATKGSSSLLAQQLLGVALPLTNTFVVLTFCLQAVKAAIACLKW